MGGAPPYEENPSPHFLAVLRATVPGFEPTADGWLLVEKGLKRLLRIRDRGAFASVPADFLLSWREEDVLRVFDPLVSPFPEVRARHRTPPERPAFPEHPLDPSCVVAATLSANVKTEVVRLVRLVQTDFDPEKDPNGWDSVAVLVRGVSYGDEEIRKMGYPQLLAIFRTSAAQMRLQKTGSLTCGVATATASIVSLEMPNTPKEQARDKPCKVVLREWWDDPKNRQRILEAGSAEKIGHLVGFSETAVKEAKPIWGEIQKHLAFRRQELRGLQEMRRAEEERLGG